MGPPFYPYYSHTTPVSLSLKDMGNGMGPAYHQGGPVAACEVQGFLRLCFTALSLPAPKCHPAVWYQSGSPKQKWVNFFGWLKPKRWFRDIWYAKQKLYEMVGTWAAVFSFKFFFVFLGFHLDCQLTQGLMWCVFCLGWLERSQMIWQCLGWSAKGRFTSDFTFKTTPTPSLKLSAFPVFVGSHISKTTTVSR